MNTKKRQWRWSPRNIIFFAVTPAQEQDTVFVSAFDPGTGGSQERATESIPTKKVDLKGLAQFNGKKELPILDLLAHAFLAWLMEGWDLILVAYGIRTSVRYRSQQPAVADVGEQSNPKREHPSQKAVFTVKIANYQSL